MNKNLLIMGGVVAVAGVIATGALMSSQNSKDDLSNDGEKIDDSYLEEFLDEEKYTFCLGKEEIKGVYTNAVFGNEKGDVEYVSEDVSVFDRAKNKLYILGRKIDYTYSGNAEIAIEGGYGTMNIEESGATTEYYSKNNAPVRIDYNSKIINPAPERKNTEWVFITIKSMGTIYGLTQEDTRQEKGDAKVFCSSFNLEGGPLGIDAVITPESFSFQKTCPNNSPNPGVSFSGNFTFNCNNIDNKRGVEIAKEYRESEKLRNEFNAIDEGLDDNDSGSEFKGIIQENNSNDSDMKKKLQELKDEIKASQSIH